jgi:hypothetical protein
VKKVYNKCVPELSIAAVLTVLAAALTVSAGIQIPYFISHLSVVRFYRTTHPINVANAPSTCTSWGAETLDNKWYLLDTITNRAEYLQVLSRLDNMRVYLSNGSVQVVQSVRTKGSVTQSWGCIFSHSGGGVGDWGGHLWTHTHTI